MRFSELVFTVVLRLSTFPVFGRGRDPKTILNVIEESLASLSLEVSLTVSYTTMSTQT